MTNAPPKNKEPSTSPEKTQPIIENSEESKISFISVVLSVLQASFGVQNKKNRERDFGKNSSLLPFIVAAIIFTAVFVLSLVFVVRMVLP